MFSFSSFSPIEVTGQKQLEYNFSGDVQILNAADKNREREREREERLKANMQVPSTNQK